MKNKKRKHVNPAAANTVPAKEAEPKEPTPEARRAAFIVDLDANVIVQTAILGLGGTTELIAPTMTMLALIDLATGHYDKPRHSDMKLDVPVLVYNECCKGVVVAAKNLAASIGTLRLTMDHHIRAKLDFDDATVARFHGLAAGLTALHALQWYLERELRLSKESGLPAPQDDRRAEDLEIANAAIEMLCKELRGDEYVFVLGMAHVAAEASAKVFYPPESPVHSWWFVSPKGAGHDAHEKMHAIVDKLGATKSESASKGTRGNETLN